MMVLVSGVVVCCFLGGLFFCSALLIKSENETDGCEFCVCAHENQVEKQS